MSRILTRGTLLLVLTGAAWSMPGCGDDDTPADADVVDVGFITVDTSANVPDGPPLDAGPTTAPR